MARSSKGKINKLENALELYLDEQISPETEEEIQKEAKKEAEPELDVNDKDKLQSELKKDDILQSNGPEQLKNKAEVNNKAKPQSKTKTHNKVKPQKQIETKANPQSEPDDIQNLIQKEELNNKPQMKTSSNVDEDLLTLKSRIESNAPKIKFEDYKVKRTYWLDPEEIEMVNIIAEKAKIDKYEVVGKAIRFLYKNLFQ